MGHGGNMASLSLEYIIDSAYNRPDLYIPMLVEKFYEVNEELLNLKIEHSELQQKFYAEQDKRRSLEDSVRFATKVAMKIVEGPLNAM